MKIKLTNNFHDTVVTLIAKKASGHPDKYTLSARQVQKAKKTLCGIADCRCSGALGDRGPQTAETCELCDGSAVVYVD